jgi:hypothetical protein
MIYYHTRFSNERLLDVHGDVVDVDVNAQNPKYQQDD